MPLLWLVAEHLLRVARVTLVVLEGKGFSVWLAAVVAELDTEDEEYEVKEEIKFDGPDVGASQSCRRTPLRCPR